ncbi:hypothetical protein GIB67_016549 [Kingdonia uniflora]|uniref:Uncharacterized protein n=1 Tax=Kingdonia uniflora TaxID=39325 RepID=A0A7J7NQD2_9MAGN|nr:hypothetical protein GIB67_016549 [Kingdonia uniflora]
MSENEAAEAEEDFYCMWRFYHIFLTGEQRWRCLRILVEDKVEIFGLIDYDPDPPVTECQFESLDWMGRELEHGRRFYEELFREVIVEPSARKEAMRLIVEEEIELEDMRIAGGELLSGIVREGFGAASDSYYDLGGSNLICRVVIHIESSPVNEASTSGRSTKSENVVSNRDDKIEVVQFPDFHVKLISYPLNFDVFREFCKAKASVGGRWGNFVELAGPQSKVMKKEFLLDTVIQEGTKLEAVLNKLGINIKKRANNRSEKVQKSQTMWLITDRAFPKKKMLKRGSTSGTTGSEDKLKVVEDSAKLAVHNGEEEMSKMAACLMKGIYLGMEEEKAELEKGKAELEKKVTCLKTEIAREEKWLDSLKASQEVEISEMTAKTEKNLGEVVIQHDRLGCHLLKIRYSKTEVNDIMAETYVEGEEDVVVEVVDLLDGVAPQMVRDNQGDDNERPEEGNGKIKYNVDSMIV